MATQNQDVDSQDRWKSRYYEALGEIEERETAWREAERLLRHLITRLSLAADPRHTALTQNLTELRSAIRDGRDILRLRELINQISSQVGELDEVRAQAQSSGHSASILLELLEQIALPEDAGRELRQLKKQIKKLKEGEETGALYSQFVSLINSALSDQEPEAAGSSRRQKLLDRILKRQEKDDSQTEPGDNNGALAAQADASGAVPGLSQKLMAPAVGDLLLQLGLRMPDAVKRKINFPALKKHTNRARTRRDLIAIVDVIAQQVESAYREEQPAMIMIDDESVGALAQAVHQIIKQLNPPHDLSQRVVDLEQFFSERNRDVGGLIHCLNTLADMVAEMSRRLSAQRDELEAFCSQFSVFLRELDLGLQDTANLYNESQQDTLHLDRAVHDELRSIQESIQLDSEISQPGTGIQSRLDAINQHLLAFHDAEKVRYVQVQNTIRELGEKVTSLESDSNRLRDRLEETCKQAMYDVLTGLPNRQAYEERLVAEVARSKRYKTPLIMVVWDIDGFRRINTSYGHAGGDKVLKAVSEMLSQEVRETDFVARYGGNEFAMLMPQTSIEDGLQVAEKLRKMIEERTFHFHDVRVNISISAGAAQLRQDETIDSLFERADSALYAAKEAGRNQVKAAET